MPTKRTLYHFDEETREYTTSSAAYVETNEDVPANACLEAPGIPMDGYAILRSEDLSTWEYVEDHRGKIVYDTATGEPAVIDSLGYLPPDVTTVPPTNPFDVWDGKEWKPCYDNEHATVGGVITVYSYDILTRELTTAVEEYLAPGVGLPAQSCIDEPPPPKEGFAICRTEDEKGWEYIEDHRGETVYNTETRRPQRIVVIGPYPENVTLQAPATQYDYWDGKKWITDVLAERENTIREAEDKKQSLIDSAMQTIADIQLKLRLGRELTEVDKVTLNKVLDYIERVRAVDTKKTAAFEWPTLE